MKHSSEHYLQSRRKRSVELAAIGVVSPVIGVAAAAISVVLGKRFGRHDISTKVDRSLTPGIVFQSRKFGHPEKEDKLLKVLRQSMLDELPQVGAILRGEMTLIGPRADKPLHIEQLFDAIPDDETRQKWEEVRRAQKPGIISSYALHSHGLNLEGTPEDMRVKVSQRETNALLRARLDIADYEKAGVLHDMKLLGKTLGLVATNYAYYAKRKRQKS